MQRNWTCRNWYCKISINNQNLVLRNRQISGFWKIRDKEAHKLKIETHQMKTQLLQGYRAICQQRDMSLPKTTKIRVSWNTCLIPCKKTNDSSASPVDADLPNKNPFLLLPVLVMPTHSYLDNLPGLRHHHWCFQWPMEHQRHHPRYYPVMAGG